MRVTLFVAAFAAIATLAPVDGLRSALAGSAGALFEATPFLLAGAALSWIARGRTAAEYFGCGCESGPAARSLPAAAATWLTFGPAIAIARFVAAIAVARLVRARFGRDGPHACAVRSDEAQLLERLAALVPAALTAGAAMQLAALVDLRGLTAFEQLLGGAVLGFAASPCALGAVAIAGALHVRAPLAAASYLCIAGIADARAVLLRRTSHPRGHDLLAYALLTLALGIVAWRRGGALVHPAIASALAICAAVTIVQAVRHRARQNARVRFAPALMLLGALVAAPAPAYRATETTMSDLFAGEHLTFTGVVTRDANATALVRYAITCCRADAAPVVVRLAKPPGVPAGTWLRIDGVIETAAGEPRLASRAVQRIAPPSDPFVYR